MPSTGLTGGSRKFLCLALLANIVLPTSLTLEASAYPIAGRGLKTCADYLASENGLPIGTSRSFAKDNLKYFTENLSYNEWLMGYISGINANSFMHNSDRPEVKYANSLEVYKLVHDYCDTHPTDKLEDAVGYIVGKRWRELGWSPKEAATPSVAQPTPSPAPPTAMGIASPPATTANSTALVVFQPTASETDVNALLQAYKATVLEGPSAAGAYKLQFATPLTADQLKQYIDWMKSETKIVKDAVAG